MLQEVVLYLTQLVKVVGCQGGGEGEQPILSVDGVTSKPWPPTMTGKEAGYCGCQSRNVDHSRS